MTISTNEELTQLLQRIEYAHLSYEDNPRGDSLKILEEDKQQIMNSFKSLKSKLDKVKDLLFVKTMCTNEYVLKELKKILEAKL